MASKRQTIIALIVVVVLVAAGIVIVTGSNNKATAGGINYAIDAEGRNITIDASPEKIISTSPAITTLVYALGAQQKLVAVDSYSDYPSNITERVADGSVSLIGGFWDPNPESIVNASGANNSQALVLLDSSVQSDVDMAAQLDQFGINYVYFYEGANTTQVYENIALGGKVLHESTNATNLITTMQDRFASILSSVGAQGTKPSVMFMDYYGSPSNVVGNHTFINDVITAAGGVNAFANVSSYQSVSDEAMVASNPDYIIVSSSMNGQDSQSVYDQVMNDTILSSTPAVHSGHVYVIDGQMEDCFLQNGIREIDGAQILAEILYPSLFNNISVPHVIGDEYANYLPSGWSNGSAA